jgi:hypothetical protein
LSGAWSSGKPDHRGLSAHHLVEGVPGHLAQLIEERERISQELRRIRIEV